LQFAAAEQVMLTLYVVDRIVKKNWSAAVSLALPGRVDSIWHACRGRLERQRVSSIIEAWTSQALLPLNVLESLEKYKDARCTCDIIDHIRVASWCAFGIEVRA
jgi:hypothetical protein